MTKAEAPELARISVRGIVQGVGFRPFVYRLATDLNLKGWVCNTSEDVRIEIEGPRESIDKFCLNLKAQAPPLAHIEEIAVTHLPAVGYRDFDIRRSLVDKGKYQLISPDIATCRTCLDELLDPNDRRYRYPFTNCTNCGPRFTIIEDMPYDRPKTTMRSFAMCPRCQAEYDNPLDRRFHAQPNACPICGPRVELVDNRGCAVSCSDAMDAAGQMLKAGEIVAIKGLGGFLLACDATSELAVKSLRHRKRRSSKPFAVMVENMEEAKRHCYISMEEEGLLSSPQSPIVLARWRQESTVSREVAPNLRYLGVMLPYTPLHHILLSDVHLPLVMTSGNLSEEPIAKDNDEALRRLSGIADYFLIHNRDIYSRYDDSVAMVERGSSQLIRRARSYAPYPIPLKFKVRPVLGCGAHLKNTFCLTRDKHAFLSQHIGDMENIETVEHFADTVSLYERLFRIKPVAVAHDLHPDYLATRYAMEMNKGGIELIPVQHHHAHVASCMADNGLQSPVIGVVFDGTGLGSDGHIWGGEFLVADYHSSRRVGHLEYLPLPGGDAATRKPYRITLAYLLALLGEEGLRQGLALMKDVDNAELAIIQRQVEKRLNSPLTSSIGRLFDAVSALLGIRGEIDYEGQAAIELEMAAYKAPHEGEEDSYPYSVAEDGALRIIKVCDLFSTVIKDSQQGVPRSIISVKFHNTVAQMVKHMCLSIAGDAGTNKVVLSGGVFQNRLLLNKTVGLLERSNFEVYTHKQVPCNDGGISLGQAVIASFA